jgi:transcription elongation factor SPT4
MVCGIIQSQSTFLNKGCPNCEEFIGYTGNADQVQDCTSANFNGVISLAEPSKSWVAKWQRLEKNVPGLYAVQVVGSVPPEILLEMQSRGVAYFPRDGTREEDRAQDDDEYE